jgi:phosphoribosyl 1,2-cyclic phosphodiesterase
MTLTVTILGCGSSGGVPRPGSGWGACDPAEPEPAQALLDPGRKRPVRTERRV